MKTINKVFNIIVLYMFTVLLIMISVTFLTEYLSSINWFGDVVRERCGHHRIKVLAVDEWGSRHIIYFWFNFLMFIVSTARLIVSLNHCIGESKNKK